MGGNVCVLLSYKCCFRGLSTEPDADLIMILGRVVSCGANDATEPAAQELQGLQAPRHASESVTPVRVSHALASGVPRYLPHKSPRETQCCPKRFSAVNHDTTIVDGTVPVSMVTAWLALFSNELPKSEAAFTSSCNDIIAGYDTVQDPTLYPLTLNVNGTKSTAGFTTAADHLSFYSLDQLFSDNLNSLYNIKLAQTEPAHRHYVNYYGKTIDGAVFPATNTLIKQRALPLLHGAVRPGQDADALLGSVPRMTSKDSTVVHGIAQIWNCSAVVTEVCLLGSLIAEVEEIPQKLLPHLPPAPPLLATI
ncbi:hypothetical protein E2C01_018223 [Portunus trituberculatus]|uniref:Uncharacterized protein n=1 Tax=Portunus trituberculatus TaxID=210409 RepID=A0A5B7DTY9_PORTR|nr:hypothetical protein [Portunus trituberculatus]